MKMMMNKARESGERITSEHRGVKYRWQRKRDTEVAITKQVRRKNEINGTESKAKTRVMEMGKEREQKYSSVRGEHVS